MNEVELHSQQIRRVTDILHYPNLVGITKLATVSDCCMVQQGLVVSNEAANIKWFTIAVTVNSFMQSHVSFTRIAFGTYSALEQVNDISMLTSTALKCEGFAIDVDSPTISHQGTKFALTSSFVLRLLLTSAPDAKPITGIECDVTLLEQ